MAYKTLFGLKETQNSDRLKTEDTLKPSCWKWVLKAGVSLMMPGIQSFQIKKIRCFLIPQTGNCSRTNVSNLKDPYPKTQLHSNLKRLLNTTLIE
jgi:hypothetical protein